MRNIIRIGAGTDRRNRFVAIALGVALAVGPAAMLPAAALAAPATDAAAASTTAGATITLQGADGASLAGHTFDVYRIGTYTDQVLDGTRISSLGVRGDTASNAWAADAIGIANAYDPSTADDIAKVYGYDDAGNIANIKMDSQTRQLRNISKALGQSAKKPAPVAGGANLMTTRSTLTINVPAEGLYYITDSAGNPIMIGTKSGNANIMKNDAKDPQWRTLGVAVVKAKSVRVDKKVQVQRNGATVGKDGTTNDPVGVTVGDTVTNTVEVTVPNKAKDEADKAYEKAKADYDAKLADKQASDKELAAAKQAEAEAQKKAEEEAKKQQEAQKKADQAKKDAEAKKQKAEQAKKQAAGVTNNGLASTGSDTTAIATLAAIMTIAGAGCVLVRVRSAKHADGWHAVED